MALSKLESVYIIESLKPVDFYERQLDGYAANEILRILRTRSKYRIAFTKLLIRRSIAEAAAGGFEVLHFSSHGNSGGIRITDGTRLSWTEFAENRPPRLGAREGAGDGNLRWRR